MATAAVAAPLAATARQAAFQHQAEQLSAATLRALTGRAQLHFEGGRLHDGLAAVPARAPHLHLDPAVDSFADYRGVSDALALRLRHSDAQLHRSLLPDEPVARLIFEWLEQFRTESLADSGLPGVGQNVGRRFRVWSDRFLASGATESSLGILVFAISQMAWSRIMAQPLPEAIEDLLEPTRAGLAPALGHALAGLRRSRHDQRAFAEHAAAIARDIAARVECETEDDPQSGRASARGAVLQFDFEDEGDEGFSAVPTGDSAVFLQGGGHYRIFTREFDETLPVEDLVRPALLSQYRSELDERVARQAVNVPRLARALQALLARPHEDGWRFGEEEGVLDGRRLAQLVSSPGERRVFRRDQRRPLSDSAVSFLVDCSGSMKQHRATLAVLLDILARALQLAGVDHEILGFTTRTWNGGRARQQWMSAGRPPAPGRLNEACHLVFKDADTSWRRARPGIAGLMKADLFREGIDGEAVAWACQRLMAKPRRRRLLVVISDGCPMDTATNLANDPFYLDNHLKAVLRQVDGRDGLDVVGLGVGLDLSPYYRRSVPVDLSAGLANSVFDQLLVSMDGVLRA